MTTKGWKISETIGVGVYNSRAVNKLILQHIEIFNFKITENLTFYCKYLHDFEFSITSNDKNYDLKMEMVFDTTQSVEEIELTIKRHLKIEVERDLKDNIKQMLSTMETFLVIIDQEH